MEIIGVSDIPRGVHIVCWYNEFRRNPMDGFQPQVNVVLRSRDELSSRTSFQEFPLGVTYLGQLRIGSVVVSDGVEGVVDRTLPDLHQERFAVDFTRGSWEFGEAATLGNLLAHIPWLNGFQPRGPMLVFPLEDRRSLWIPCTEFFSRCYGRSQEIKRVLSLYSWKNAKRRLFGLRDMPRSEESGVWTIRLQRPLVPGDAVFLAHVWHDADAQGRAKTVYAQLESRLPAVADPLGWKSFVEVGPWFEGPAELLVRGFWVGDEGDRKFLALRVDGCSDPQGVPVRYVRGDDGKSSSGTAAKGKRVRYVTKRKAPGKVRVTDRVEPDRGSPSIVFDDPPFEVLGERRDVKQVKAGIEPPVRAVKGTGGEPAAYSSSEPYSTGKGVYGISMAAPDFRHLGDVLSDMWETFLHLQETDPPVVSSLAWVALDPDSRFRHRVEGLPQLIPLEPFTSTRDDNLSGRVLNWPWLDPKDLGLGRRGLLVVHCMVGGVPVYFVEVQRRPGKRENFRGMVFRMKADETLDNWFHEVRSGVRDVKGVFSKLRSKCPGVAEEFIHFPPLPSREGKMMYVSAVLRALEKIGLHSWKGGPLEGIW